MKKYIVLVIMLLSLLGSAISPSLIAADKKPGTTAIKKGKKATQKKSSGKADYNALNFLPFGIGQFRQGRPIMGGVLGGGQAMMLFLYMDRKKQISASNKDASATIAEIDPTQPADADTDAYLKRNADYVKKTNSEANLCLIGFMGLYAAGVIDAVWDPLGSRHAAAKKATEVGEMDEGAAKWAAEKKLDLLQNKPRFSMFALPTTDKSKNTFGLTLEKSFR